MPVNTKNLDEARAEIVAVLKRQVAAANARRLLLPLSEALTRIFPLGGDRDKLTRAQWREMLGAFAAFMKCNGFPPSAIAGVIELEQALEQLDHGLTHEALKPKVFAARHQAGLSEWRKRQYESIAIDCFVQQSASVRQPSELVAGPRADRARYWYREFVSGNVNNKRAAKIFENKEAVIQIARSDCERQRITATADNLAKIILSLA